ncbi:DUF2711 family protein [Mucilaginibacter sp. L196]|uniref:DUF2711 family protein n=1 Tax=Mucilaginibacter sp. L196 TaxID=1641870 RepID=UPI00131EA1AB|nr:DUF2711 family protein [Mucilaginibacter sp. L196]
MAQDQTVNSAKASAINKPPFEAKHDCICAPADTPILKFYRGYFDSVYIMLHPFYSMNDKKEITKTYTWAEMVSLTGFNDLNQLDIAMRNSIGGLNKNWKNEKDVEILQTVCTLNDIWIPSEGLFQDSLRSEMLLGIQEQGHHYMFVADGYGYERKLTYIPDFLIKDDIVLEWSGRENWYTNKNEILYTSHWDSHHTLLCSDKETIESILSKHPFEGFYCDAETEIYWSCQAYEKRN